MDAPESAPAWTFALAGALVTLALLEQLARGPQESELRARLPEGFVSADPPRLEHASPRDLRALPGIGETRALAIARSRFEEGPIQKAEQLERIRGIGPVTVERVRAALEQRARGRR
jgi:competence ComEA-like helix-hairpin-helix protein